MTPVELVFRCSDLTNQLSLKADLQPCELPAERLLHLDSHQRQMRGLGH